MQVNLLFIQESRASLTFHCRWSGKFHVVMDQRQLVNSLRARKAHVTTKEKALTEALEALQADSPAIICSRLKESLTRFEAAVKGVDETYLRLEEVQGDDQTYQEWSAKHSE